MLPTCPGSRVVRRFPRSSRCPFPWSAAAYPPRRCKEYIATNFGETVAALLISWFESILVRRRWEKTKPRDLRRWRLARIPRKTTVNRCRFSFEPLLLPARRRPGRNGFRHRTMLVPKACDGLACSARNTVWKVNAPKAIRMGAVANASKAMLMPALDYRSPSMIRCWIALVRQGYRRLVIVKARSQTRHVCNEDVGLAVRGPAPCTLIFLCFPNHRRLMGCWRGVGPVKEEWRRGVGRGGLRQRREMRDFWGCVLSTPGFWDASGGTGQAVTKPSSYWNHKGKRRKGWRTRLLLARTRIPIGKVVWRWGNGWCSKSNTIRRREGRRYFNEFAQ